MNINIFNGCIGGIQEGHLGNWKLNLEGTPDNYVSRTFTSIRIQIRFLFPCDICVCIQIAPRTNWSWKYYDVHEKHFINLQLYLYQWKCFDHLSIQQQSPLFGQMAVLTLLSSSMSQSYLKKQIWTLKYLGSVIYSGQDSSKIPSLGSLLLVYKVQSSQFQPP